MPESMHVGFHLSGLKETSGTVCDCIHASGHMCHCICGCVFLCIYMCLSFMHPKPCVYLIVSRFGSVRCPGMTVVPMLVSVPADTVIGVGTQVDRIPCV